MPIDRADPVPAVWRIRVRGEVGAVTALALRGFDVTRHGGLTTLEGSPVPALDLAALLLRIQSHGLEVVDVVRVGAAAERP